MLRNELQSILQKDGVDVKAFGTGRVSRKGLEYFGFRIVGSGL